MTFLIIWLLSGVASTICGAYFDRELSLKTLISCLALGPTLFVIMGIDKWVNKIDFIIWKQKDRRQLRLDIDGKE